MLKQRIDASSLQSVGLFCVQFQGRSSALAIRSGKIYLQSVPKIPRRELALFLDIESLPDADHHYLIGLTVRDGSHVSHHSFWSDCPEDESQMWLRFFETLQDYPDALIYHYGIYERRVIEKVAKRYDYRVEPIVKRMFNVASTVYGIVYFPVRSNSLKDLGRFVGATWTSPDASELQSIVWRYLWEETHDPVWKQQLLTYNQEDCSALLLLTDRISAIADQADTMESIAFTDRPKRQATEVGTQLHTQFETIIGFAHFDYREKRISLRAEPEGRFQHPSHSTEEETTHLPPNSTFKSQQNCLCAAATEMPTSQSTSAKTR